MKVTILGCGTSSGVPTLACKCKVCRSKNPKNNRTRASAWIQLENKKSILIDTGPDFRAQALREKIERVDAVLYTHPHSDHIGGLDDLRAFNFAQQGLIPVYGHEWTLDRLNEVYSYIFSGKPAEGGDVAKLKQIEIKPTSKSFQLFGQQIQPLFLPHGSMSTIGFRIGNFGYIVDCHEIPSELYPKLKGLKALVLDCVKIKPHPTHLNLQMALDASSKIAAEKTYLTHLGHDFDYRKTNRMLPKGVELAYDGLNIKIS